MQRSGRAGRDGPGKCFRLYQEATFHALAAATVPEIQRSNLAAVVLQLKAAGVQDVLQFPLLDPPPRAALVKALEALYALDALVRGRRSGQCGRAACFLHSTSASFKHHEAKASSCTALTRQRGSDALLDHDQAFPA